MITTLQPMPTTYQTNLMEKGYNGWSSYETWNVSLWIQNSEVYYDIALQCDDYQDFVDALEACGFNSKATPDGVKWSSAKINTVELDEMIQELKD